MESLKEIVQHAYDKTEEFRNRMNKAKLTPSDIHTLKDLSYIPILKKEDLPAIQQGVNPFRSLSALPTSKMARLFMSPGPIYDPQTEEGDYWRFSEALEVAGFTGQDIVQNTFSYHLSPAGFMFDSALRQIGSTVVPTGTGNRELQIQVMKDLQVTGYVGTPSFLGLLIDTAEQKGYSFGSEIILNKAFFTAEMVTNEFRERCNRYGIDVFEGYGTADCGLLTYEDKQGPGLKVSPTVTLQICDPVTGNETEDIGEIVVTLFNKSYPLIRFGTGDLSQWVEGHKGSRIKGVLGRVSDGVKVKGMFVRETQLATALEEQGYKKFQAIVTMDHNQDRLEIFVESEQPIDSQLDSKIKDIIRVTPIITKVSSLTIEEGQKRLVDQRNWDNVTSP